MTYRVFERATFVAVGINVAVACTSRVPEAVTSVSVPRQPSTEEEPPARPRPDSGYSCKAEAFSQCIEFSNLAHLTLRGVFGTAEDCVFSSDSGGNPWVRRSCAAQVFQDAPFDKVQAVSPTEAWLLTDLYLYRSDDSGTTWNRITLPPFAGPRGFRFVSPDLGFWVGEEGMPGNARGVIYRTVDGGKSWSRLQHPATFPYEWRFRDVWAVTDEKVWVAGDTLLESANGGDTWTEVEADRSYRDVGIRFSTENVGWISRYPTEHYLLTVDGGRTWATRELPWPGADSTALAFVDDKLGWAAAGDVIRRTSDGGLTWTEESLCPAPHTDREDAIPYQFAEYVGGAVVIAGPCGRAILSRDQ